MPNIYQFVAAGFIALRLVQPASAAVIDFNALPGAQGDKFTSYTENGFTVATRSGDVFEWFDANYGPTYGNPVPAIFGSDNYEGAPATDNISVKVTKAGGGTFTFDSIDVNATNDSPFLEISGFLGQAKVYDVKGEAGFNYVPGYNYNCNGTVSEPFCTANPGESSETVSSVIISLTQYEDPLHLAANFLDNIVLDAAPAPTGVPEPSSILMLVSGGVLFSLALGRRKMARSLVR